MGSQAAGFGQRVVMGHSELEHRELLHSCSHRASLPWAHCRALRHTENSSPTPAEGFKTGGAWNTEYTLEQGIWKTLKNPYAHITSWSVKLLIQQHEKSIWGISWLRDKIICILCAGPWGLFPLFVFLMSCKFAVELTSKLFQILSSDYLYTLQPVHGSPKTGQKTVYINKGF